jgi:hypothetical protein
MMESHDLMAVTDRAVPDHIRHSGNVYFVGYYLLNSVPAFKVLETFPHYRPEAFTDSGGDDRFEQLNLAWLVASLFHDSGYAVEHSKSTVACLSRITGADLSRIEKEMLKACDVAREVRPLIDYCNGLGNAGEKVGRALTWVTENWNQKVPTRVGTKEIVFDHGVLSAARLLHLSKATNPLREIPKAILQAASAMALHNAEPLRVLFAGDQLSQLDVVPFSLFPVAALLALCDAFQIWDREVNDAAAFYQLDALTTIEQVKRAFISNSRVIRFEWKPSPEDANLWVGEVHIKYSLQHGENTEEICDSLKASITRWITSGRGKEMSKLFSLNPIIRVRVLYWMPRSDDPLVAEF